MGMDQSNYDRYKLIYKSYLEVYDLPLIKTDFYQDDDRAMDYCQRRDFVALIVPFGDPSAYLANHIVVQNNLVSYTKMFSDLIGGSARKDKDFLQSAIEIAKKKANLSRLEECTPVALIENSFTYKDKNHSHYGVVFMARIPKGSTLNKDVVSKSTNEKVYFANPHNQVLFDLAKQYVEQYKTNKTLQAEISYSRRVKLKDIKKQKEKFIVENAIDLSDYYQFKSRIVSDIAMLTPQSIIDIACGNDDIIYSFLKISDNTKVFANDIALAYLEGYHYNKKEHRSIHFSNLNAVELPFKEKSIDIVFCKNLLHHLNRGDRKKLINNCLKICSRMMVIVEILSYDEQNEAGKKLHDEFYCGVLKETKGREDLTSQQLDELVKDSLIDVRKNETVETQNGIYKYIWITKREL